MKGSVKRRKREHNDRAWMTWHIANLTAYAPRKASEFIRLDAMLYRDPIAPSVNRQRQWEGDFARVKAFMAGKI